MPKKKTFCAVYEEGIIKSVKNDLEGLMLEIPQCQKG